MSYRIHLLPEALKDLSRLDRSASRRVITKLKWWAENFESLTPEPLKGPLEGFYKLRVGNYRVICEIIFQEKLIIVHAVGHRRDIYRKRSDLP